MKIEDYYFVVIKQKVVGNSFSSMYSHQCLYFVPMNLQVALPHSRWIFSYFNTSHKNSVQKIPIT